MKQRFRFRYVNEVVGGFVLLSALIVALAVYSIGRARGFYGEKLTVELRFRSLYSVIGLQEGAEVRTLGSKIGRVAKLDVDDPHGIRAELRIDGRYRRYVPQDASAKVTRTLGITGEPFVEIVPGSGSAPPIEEGAVIVVAEKSSLPQTLEGTILRLNNLIDKTYVLVEKVSRGEGILGTLISDQESSRSLSQTLKNLELVTGNLAQGNGSAGRLLVEDSAVESFEEFSDTGTRVFKKIESGKGLAGLLVDSQSTAEEFQKAIGNIAKITESLSKDAETLGGLLFQLESTMVESKRLIQQLQRSWLLPEERRRKASKRLLAPSEINK